jgi:FAD-dependent urate hydroxylase
VHDLSTIPTWHRGPVVLLGDAAHATSPNAGQGASLAMEDALVLALCLRDIPEVDGALATYNSCAASARRRWSPTRDDKVA